MVLRPPTPSKSINPLIYDRGELVLQKDKKSPPMTRFLPGVWFFQSVLPARVVIVSARFFLRFCHHYCMKRTGCCCGLKAASIQQLMHEGVPSFRTDRLHVMMATTVDVWVVCIFVAEHLELSLTLAAPCGPSSASERNRCWGLLSGRGSFSFLRGGVSLAGGVSIVTARAQTSPRATSVPLPPKLLLVDLVHSGFK